MNRNKIGAGILLLAVLLTGVVFVASASDDNSQNTLPKGEIFEFNESNSQRVELPDFGPHTYDYLRKDLNVLATKGKIPQYDTQVERQNWLAKLNDIRVIARNELSPYAYPKGPVLAHGFDINGTMKVFLYEGMNVTDPQINEIYNVINAIGNKKNIQDIPVIFKKSDFVKDAVASGYDTKYRNPLIGAIQLTGQTGARGTLGFCAKTGSGTGYVTAQHLGTHVGYQMYQPTKTSQNSLGTVSMISGHHADACFVPYGDVSAKIHIGNGNTLPVVTYMSAQPSDEWSGLTVYKSGRTTGVTNGTILGVIDIDNSLGKYYDLIETDVHIESGDSGGPLYTMPTSANKCNIIGIAKGVMAGNSLFSSVYGIKYDLAGVVVPITT